MQKRSAPRTRSRRFRMTSIRSDVLGSLSRARAPLTAAEVHRRVRPHDLVTVYRTLETLAQQKLIDRIAGTGRSLRFEIHRSHHHHVTCRICGKTRDLPACDFSPIASAAKRAGYAIESHSLEVSGVCASHRPHHSHTQRP